MDKKKATPWSIKTINNPSVPTTDVWVDDANGRALLITGPELAALIVKAVNRDHVFDQLGEALKPFGGEEPLTYETEYDGRMYTCCASCGAQLSEGEGHWPHCDWLAARAALKSAKGDA